MATDGFATEASRGPSIAPEHSRLAQKLVDALDSDSYLVRQKARESLLRLGRASIDPLEYGAKSESAEVRLRSIELLIALRGRGLLGMVMLQAPFDSMPDFGAGVKSVSQGMPAEQGGMQTGDLIVEINGNPIRDNNELQHIVFQSGPMKVVDVVVERGNDRERVHLPVMLTLNMTGMSNPMPPPVNLENDLSDEERMARAAARETQLRTNGFGQGFVVINGQVVQQTQPQPQATPLQPVNAQELEADFERVKAEAQHGEGDVEKPAGK